jgi:hypothetical protein
MSEATDKPKLGRKLEVEDITALPYEPNSVQRMRIAQAHSYQTWLERENEKLEGRLRGLEERIEDLENAL